MSVPSWRRFPLALVVAVAAAVPAPGAGQGLGVGLAPDASFVRWNDGLGMEDAVLFGGQGTLEFGRYVRLQAGYRRATGIDTRFDELGLDGGENRVDASLASTAVLLRLGARRLAPILAGVGGVARFEPEGRDATDHVYVGWGGGLGLRVTDWLETRVMIQDLRLRADRALLAADGDPATDPGGGDLRGSWLATLGLGARLGGSSSARAAALDGDVGEVLLGSTERLLVPVELNTGVVRFDDALGVGDRSTVGVRGGVDLGPYFGLRGAWWGGVTDGYDAFRDVRGWSGEAQFNLGRVTGASPFLLMGYGEVSFDDDFLNDVGESVPDQSALILGAGFGFPLSDRSRFVAALRDHVTTAGSLAGTSSPGDLRHSLGIDVGLSLLVFGSRARLEVPPSVVAQRVLGSEEAGPAPAADTGAAGPAIPPATAVTPGGVVRPASGPQPPDSASPGYHSDRTVTLPVPTVGELYIRYGPPTPGSPRIPEPDRPAGGATPGAAASLDPAVLEALVRAEVARLAVRADSAALTRADLIALEARIIQRLGEAPGRDPATSAGEIVRLEAQVAELTRIVRQGLVEGSATTTSSPGAGAMLPPTYLARAVDGPGPRITALEAGVGTSTPRDGGTGVGASFDVSFQGRWLFRPFAGIEAGRASVRTRLGESSVIGSVTSLGGSVGTYVDVGPVGPLSPSLSLAVTGLGGSVGGRTDQDEELMDRLYEGFSAGPDVGLHVAYHRPGIRWLLTGGIRRLWAGSRSRWSVEAGVRLPRRPSAPVVTFEAYPDSVRAGRAPAADTVVADPGRPDTARAAAADPALLERLEALEAALAAEAEARRAAADDDARTRTLERARADSVAAAARVDAARREDAAAEAAARAAAERDALRRDLESLVGVLPDVLMVRGTDRGLEVVLGGGLFGVGSATLDDGARATLARVAARLRTAEGNDLLVEGHTDATGAPEANVALSLRRAEAVRAALVSAGIPPARISAVGSGEALPLADNGTASGRARNRRVEIVLLGFDVR